MTSLYLKEAKCYLMMIFTELIAINRIKENEQRKGGRKLSLSECLDIATAARCTVHMHTYFHTIDN
jgi:hypothetical protein